MDPSSIPNSTSAIAAAAPAQAALPPLSDARASFDALRLTSGLFPANAAAYSSVMPCAALYSPFAPLPALEPPTASPLHRCGACGGYLARNNGATTLAPGDEPGTAVWTCRLCGRCNSVRGDMVALSRALPNADTFECIDAVPIGVGCGAVVVAVDAHLGVSEAADVLRAVRSMFRAACVRGKQRFVLLVYGSRVEAAVATTGVLEAVTPEAVETMSPGDKRARFFMEGDAVAAAELVFQVALSNVTPSPVVGITADRNGAADDELVVLPRRLDQAIEVAIQLLQGVVDPENSRVVSFVSGCPTISSAPEFDVPIVTSISADDDTMSGPGSANGLDDIQHGSDIGGANVGDSASGVGEATASDDSWLPTWLSSGFGYLTTDPVVDQRRTSAPSSSSSRQRASRPKPADTTAGDLERVFESLGDRAGELRLALFFLFYAAEGECGARAIQAASSRSRGVIYPAPHGFPTGGALCTAAAHMSMRSIAPALLSVRVSQPLRVARVIGSAVETAEQSTFTVAGSDANQGFVIVFEVDNVSSAHAPTHAVLQLTAKSLQTTRVITLEVPLTTSLTQVLQTIDGEVAAIIMCKVCINDAPGGVSANSYKIAGALDLTARSLLSHAPPLVAALSLVFGLRRGPLVERHVGVDEGLALRAAFARADCSTSSLIMSPRAFSTSSGADAMAEEKADTDLLARMDDRTVVVVDAGLTMFVVWSGEGDQRVLNNVVESAYAVAMQRGMTELFVVRPTETRLVAALHSYLTPCRDEGVEVGRVSSGLQIIPLMTYEEYCRWIISQRRGGIAQQLAKR
jgi:hypothetical protein